MAAPTIVQQANDVHAKKTKAKEETFKRYDGYEELNVVAEADIPRREMWLWGNKEAIDGIERSFKQAEAGELKDVPSRFIEFDEDGA